jgi:hypothetical protein
MGSAASFLPWELFSAADTLTYVDLPLLTHYGCVTMRLMESVRVEHFDQSPPPVQS